MTKDNIKLYNFEIKILKDTIDYLQSGIAQREKELIKLKRKKK